MKGSMVNRRQSLPETPTSIRSWVFSGYMMHTAVIKKVILHFGCLGLVFRSRWEKGEDQGVNRWTGGAELAEKQICVDILTQNNHPDCDASCVCRWYAKIKKWKVYGSKIFDLWPLTCVSAALLQQSSVGVNLSVRSSVWEGAVTLAVRPVRNKAWDVRFTSPSVCEYLQLWLDFVCFFRHRKHLPNKPTYTHWLQEQCGRLTTHLHRSATTRCSDTFSLSLSLFVAVSRLDEREAVQKKTFTKWVNSHLSRVSCRITDLYMDLRDGRMLIKLLEVLSGERLVGKS